MMSEMLRKVQQINEEIKILEDNKRKIRRVYSTEKTDEFAKRINKVNCYNI